MPSLPDRAPEPGGLRRGDVLTAAVTWAVALAGLLVQPALTTLDGAGPSSAPGPGTARWWAILAAVTVQAVPVAWSRLRPAPALLGVGAVVLLLALAHPGDAASVANPAVVVVAFRAALARPVTDLRGPLTGLVALVAAGDVVDGAQTDGAVSPGLVGTSVALALVVVAVGVAPALVVASRRALRAAREGELRALAREHDALVRSAVAAERTAMAREVHDIAAHHLSGIALMVSAIDRQVDTDPAAAHRGLQQVREQSRMVLGDLRRLVGLLRDEGAAEAPGPRTLAAVRDLVGAEADGGAVSVEVIAADGDLGAGLGPVAQLAAYRMVQEALSNARQHAPGAPVAVTVDDSRAAAVVVAVRNGPPAREAPPSSGGHGLLGMRERAELVGARLQHGPTPYGGWEVRLTLPRDGAAQDGGDQA